jgi:hypothetical protein
VSDLPEVQDIVRVTYRPDDVIVARVKRLLSYDEALTLRDRLRERFPDQQILIVDPTVDLEVMAPADAPTGLDLTGEPS